MTNSISQAPRRIFLEPWPSDFGAANNMDEDAEREIVEATILKEEGFAFVRPQPDFVPPLAFIDGVRRREGYLSQYVDGGVIAGVAGTFAVGSVVAPPEGPLKYSRERISRIVIWSSGGEGHLPTVGGHSWESKATEEPGIAGALNALQERMLQAEADLASILEVGGFYVVSDGSNFRRGTDDHDRRNFAGLIKSHYKRQLPLEYARLLPNLPAAHRTSLFKTESNRYSCYLRLAETQPWHSPLAGIIRLEFPGTIPLNEVRLIADRISGALPRFAGIPHADPRAPQNLQPVGALEKHLRHLMGDARLAERCLRDSIAMVSA